LREHRAGCRLPPALAAPPAVSTKPVAQRYSLKKSALTHDAVAAAVSHKHHLIIRVGVGLIQFVYGLHSHLATELTHHLRVEFFIANKQAGSCDAESELVS